jgi:Na+-translocating ferredoxin:NAD+ oxidoreductase subunit C
MLLDSPIHFGGGIKVAPNKTQSLQRPIEKALVPPLLTLPLRQHVGAPAVAIVSVGERVLKGQPIARDDGIVSAPVHASSSGTVVDIGSYPVPSPSGADAPCIVIETDGVDEWIPHAGIGDDPYALSPTQIHDKMLEAGIVGLGGAGFPSAAKMLPGIHHGINLMILNAVECEPYITCDEALIREYAGDVVMGLQLVRRSVGAVECVIGIEDNMPDAVEALRKALDDIGETSITIATLPAVYPAGGESQLIKALTGLEVPAQGLPLDLGVVCYNVGTAVAVYRAMAWGVPLISRIVTITGGAVKQPRNLEVMIGSPIDRLIEQCGGYVEEPEQYVIGGPMMGFTLQSTALPVLKTTNCVIAAAAGELRAPLPANECIRCGDCVSVCPAALLPQQLYTYARDKDYDRAAEYDLFTCIECGCCAYVCPSNIPLVDYYRRAKSEIQNQELARMEAKLARQRYESRQTRLERSKDPNDDGGGGFVDEPPDAAAMQDEIDAAVARVRARKNQPDRDPE